MDEAVADLTALLVMRLPTIPASPPDINPLEPAFVWEETLLWPPPKYWLEKFFSPPIPLAAIIASASIEPPVCPTLIPRLDIKESIFWDTFKKAMAQRNQISTLPDAVALPIAFTWACIHRWI